MKNLALVFGLILSPLVLFTAWSHAEHYDVFLISGQSNCDGRGDVPQLTGDLAKWNEPQKDVIISYSCSNLRGPAASTDGFKPLQPGFSVSPALKRPTTLPTKTFGPEVGFGRGLADGLPGKHVALIKFTEGGTSLKKDWNPDVRDRMYDQWKTFVHKSLADLESHGHTYTIRGMIWHQGESDEKLCTAKEYQELLTTFIDRVRKELKTPNLVFIIGDLCDQGKYETIRPALLQTALAVQGAYFVSSKDLTTRDHGTHFDAKSQLELGRRYAHLMLKEMKDK